ncbi:MAG TPA: hypothetical protein VK809_00130 [Bacteroidia bacterium]|nr:hypothetical protein [Bacteroidia bacterium]
MAKKTKRFLLIITVLTTMQLLTGCFIFRGKNHCGTCPNFSTHNPHYH